ncbi:MAG: DUF2244 domain-containing protein [Rhodobacteraceae bacterium]|nr:DUF2244 domain-containing protein [Paracoccaceae bacterium]
MRPSSPKFKRAAYDAALSSSAPVVREDAPIWETTLWPNRSLGRTGFRVTMSILAVGFAIPVLPFMWAGGFWVLLPFVGVAFLALWLAFKMNNRHGQLREHVSLWPDLIAVERREVDGDIKRWRCNPYWMRYKLVKEGGPVDNYLTLIGSDREIELGAFLSPEERVTLIADIESAIKGLGQNYAK